jgi:hypothetical protein
MARDRVEMRSVNGINGGPIDLSRARFGFASLWVIAIALSLSACGKPEPGGSCKEGQATCIDAKSGLFCGSDSTYKSRTCSGLSGCKAEADKVACDNDIAAVGDGCNTANDGACTADGRSMLQCKNEVFALVDTCKGPGDCKVNGGSVACDSDIAEVGDPCSTKGNFSCTKDKTTALRCDDGKYALVQSCRGPKGCGIAHPKPGVNDIDCDFTVAAANDPCAFPDNQACTADNKTILTCAGAKYTNPTPCSGPASCAVTITGKNARATCGAAGGANPALAGNYKCGSSKLVLSQSGTLVTGTYDSNALFRNVSCSVSAAAVCEGTELAHPKGKAPPTSTKPRYLALKKDATGTIHMGEGASIAAAKRTFNSTCTAAP